MAFKYRGGDRTSEDVSKRAKMAGGSYDSYLSSDAPFYKAREGDNTIRIMPPTWDDKEKWGSGWEIVVWLHRNVGPDNGTYLCLDKMLNKTCPVCEARREATDEEEADALRVSARPICYVIDRDNEKAGPQIMGMPMGLFRDINTRSVDKKTGDVILIDGDKEGYGYDVMFSRVGTDLRTKYTAVEIDRDQTNLCEDQKREDRWLDFIEEHPLPEMLVYHEADHIEKVLFGKTERRKGKNEDEEEDRPRGRRGRGGDKEEAEETERPRRGRREEPEGDKEETERPRRGRREEPEGDKEETERPRRRREEAAEPEGETERPRRGRREEPEDEKEETERPRRGRREEAEEDGDKPRGGTTQRRRSAPAEDAEEADSDSPSSQARGKLEGLRNRRR